MSSLHEPQPCARGPRLSSRASLASSCVIRFSIAAAFKLARPNTGNRVHQQATPPASSACHCPSQLPSSEQFGFRSTVRGAPLPRLALAATAATASSRCFSQQHAADDLGVWGFGGLGAWGSRDLGVWGLGIWAFRGLEALHV